MRRTDEYLLWLENAGWCAKQQRPAAIIGPYTLRIDAGRPDKRRRDIDNIIKPISDLLQHVGVVKDDCDCAEVSARWAPGQGVTVMVETL
jgi:crossover junction endodeoxyribonuclease RusA